MIVFFYKKLHLFIWHLAIKLEEKHKIISIDLRAIQSSFLLLLSMSLNLNPIRFTQEMKLL